MGGAMGKTAQGEDPVLALPLRHLLSSWEPHAGKCEAGFWGPGQQDRARGALLEPFAPHPSCSTSLFLGPLAPLPLQWDSVVPLIPRRLSPVMCHSPVISVPWEAEAGRFQLKAT